MFILLVLILTTISISLRLTASGLDLATKVASRKETEDNRILQGVARITLATSYRAMRVSAFIIARVRDLIGIVGSAFIVVEFIILVVVVVCAMSFNVLFSNGDETLTSKTSYKSDVQTTVSDDARPIGISEDSWNSADEVGKKVVSFACNAITNPPNGTYLLYRQGDTGVGYADCSVFVCAVIEGSTHRTFAGLEAPDGYDFSVNKKSDLKSYKTTYAMDTTVNSRSECIVGYTDTSIDFAKPGDILLKDGHVGIYVGVNENGDHVMVHASSHTNPHCNGDINLSDGQKLEVGFSKISGNYRIIRTSTLIRY